MTRYLEREAARESADPEYRAQSGDPDTLRGAPPAYRMVTTRGTVYVLAADGAVLARSDGPRGHNYSGRWIILGASTRHHAYRVVPLADIARDGVPGQGWIADLDHGHRRLWRMERMRSLEVIR